LPKARSYKISRDIRDGRVIFNAAAASGTLLTMRYSARFRYERFLARMKRASFIADPYRAI